MFTINTFINACESFSELKVTFAGDSKTADYVENALFTGFDCDGEPLPIEKMGNAEILSFSAGRNEKFFVTVSGNSTDFLPDDTIIAGDLLDKVADRESVTFYDNAGRAGYFDGNEFVVETESDTETVDFNLWVAEAVVVDPLNTNDSIISVDCDFSDYFTEKEPEEIDHFGEMADRGYEELREARMGW